MLISRRFSFAIILFAVTIDWQASSVAFAESLSSTICSQFSQEPCVIHGDSFMVAAANPLAVQAGYEALKVGGNAIDAAIAVQLVLNLVEPQYSGIGGGAFLLYFDSDTQTITTYDGRETAPQTASQDLFLNAEGEPLDFLDAVVGGRSVGVPGVVKLLETVHQRHGQLSWADLFEPAIRLAEQGFEVSPYLATWINSDRSRLSRYVETRQYFFHETGEPLKAGDLLQNPQFADTLRAIAQQGSAAFYTGDIAQALVTAVQHAEGNPGQLSLDDLASYEVKVREPVCIPYQGYQICGMGPPSSGGLTVGQILGILEHFDLATLGPDNTEAWRLIGEASRLAFADRSVYMADADFVFVPIQGLFNPDYLRERAGLIPDTHRILTTVEPGLPFYLQSHVPEVGLDLDLPSTTHFSIVDAEGSAVSMTSSIESAFGSRLMVRGFLLNNQLTDFSFVPEREGRSVANRVEPGKRPRSSMAPTIVLDEDGALYMVIGSPGGSRIINYVVKTLIAHLDWGFDIQGAIDLPNRLIQSGAYELEHATDAEQWQPELEALGYSVKIRELRSGLHGIVITNEGLEGGADPRREGIVRGK